MFTNLGHAILDQLLNESPVAVSMVHEGGEFTASVTHELIGGSQRAKENVETTTALIQNAGTIRDEIKREVENGTELWLLIQDHVPGKSAPAHYREWFGVAVVIAGTCEDALAYDDFLDAILAGRALSDHCVPRCRVWMFETHFPE